jgi:hypothetical protein
MSFAEELGRAVLFTAFSMTIGIVFLVGGADAARWSTCGKPDERHRP